jgi:ribosomal protein S18 acetylase RimI-like enzyme
MTNFEFLNKFLDLENQVTYDEIFEYDFARTTYSKDDNSTFANFSLVNKIMTDGQSSKLEDLYKKLDRKLSFYFENGEENIFLREYLIKNSFKKQFEDSWMFYMKNNEFDESKLKDIKKVENESDLKVFIDVFDRSYVVNDPQNPYGDVKSFIPGAENAWRKFGATGRLEYFIVFKNGIPGAVSALNNYEGIGYISCVGSLPNFRGQDLGKKATLYAVKKSIKNGNGLHCLATEEGTYPNNFYKRIGFETKFTALQMTKEEKK